MLLCIYYIAEFISYLYRFSDKFRKLGKRKNKINLDEEILNKIESLENKDHSATVAFCASLGQLIDNYAV